MTDMFISIDGEATLGTKCPTHKLEIKKMTEIEEVKAQLKVLQSKLSFLEELSKTQSPIEKAFYRVYGCYPPTTPSVSNSEDERWSNFQKGYNASKEECKVEEESKSPVEEAFREAINQGIIPEVKQPTDELIEKLIKNPPKFLKFELGQNLTDLIYDWWEDVFTTNSNDDMETSIEDLVDRIDKWLPKSQSAAGSQSLGVEDMVEGFNDALTKIKRKLR